MQSEVTDLSQLSAGHFSCRHGAGVRHALDTHHMPWLLLALLGGLRSQFRLSRFSPGSCPFAYLAAVSEVSQDPFAFFPEGTGSSVRDRVAVGSVPCVCFFPPLVQCGYSTASPGDRSGHVQRGC